MNTSHCQCGQLLFFENVVCINCNSTLAFLPDELTVAPLVQQEKSDVWEVHKEAESKHIRGRRYRMCANYRKEQVCNWAIPVEDTNAFCMSCRLDLVIPNLSIPQNREYWKQIEASKRRLVYSLLRLELPLTPRSVDPQFGLGFQFLEDPNINSVTLTGHQDGLITMNIAEADDALREKMRMQMHEPYRTLLGHFRHEIGHYYWDVLIRPSPILNDFRNLFGNETADYGLALQNYYANGAPPNWQDHFVTAYATAHPWEDWAETWSHYLHIHDSLETARDFGLIGKRIMLDPEKLADKRTPTSAFDQTIDAWAELTVALNSLARSMGQRDVYPFVLSKDAAEKMRFINSAIARYAADRKSQQQDVAQGISTMPAAQPNAAPQNVG